MANGRKLIHILLIAAVVGTGFASCGQSYEEKKRISREEQAKLRREDSLALKVGVLPSLDCLPIYVAREWALFDTAASIRLKPYMKSIDCDEALKKGRLEGNVTDLVRALRLQKQGVALDFTSSTNAYWQLVSNRKARLKELKQFSDKMIAMTRHSATALLADFAVDSAKLKQEEVFRVQVNDATLRLRMLLNNEMDAAILTEPQATTARLYKNPVLTDTRSKDMRFGVITFTKKAMKDQRRRQQIDAFIKGYNAACDSLNKYGVANYAPLVEKYCHTDAKTVAALPKMKFNHIEKPRQKDIDRAAKWLQ